MPLRIDILTLFPQMFTGVLGSSILKRAAAGAAEVSNTPSLPAVEYHVTDIRDFTTDKHSKVDAPSFGGGPGMVMQCQPVWDATEYVKSQDARQPLRIVTTP